MKKERSRRGDPRFSTINLNVAVKNELRLVKNFYKLSYNSLLLEMMATFGFIDDYIEYKALENVTPESLKEFRLYRARMSQNSTAGE